MWGLFVGGATVAARAGATYSDINPSTETVIATVPDGSAEDVDVAVAHAVEAASKWARLTPAAAARRSAT
jgi:acyl-CoA reductase-like NAD-dependent aldehyde dehydrogenase